MALFLAAGPAHAQTASAQPSRVRQLEQQVQDLQHKLDEKGEDEHVPVFWLTVGFVGQFIFGLRFVVQWIATERKKKSVIPLAFWYLSLGGTIVLLAYSIWRLDPVFIAGFSLNMIIYLRNLYFIHIHPRKQAASVQRDESDPAVGDRDATGS